MTTFSIMSENSCLQFILVSNSSFKETTCLSKYNMVDNPSASMGNFSFWVLLQVLL